MMKKKKTIEFARVVLILWLVSSFLLPLWASDYPEEVLKAKESIKGRMLLSHIDFLASEYCRGRETGDYGMKVADRYITTVLRGAGVESAGNYGGYFQRVKLNTLSLGKGIGLTVVEITTGVKRVKNARLEEDFYPVNLSAEMRVTAPVVFAGYGITAPEHKYDDYRNLDAAGKIVLVMRHEPGEKDDKSPFDGRELSKHGTLLTKILNARKHGAVGILFVTDPLNHDDLSAMGSYFMSGTFWPDLIEEKAQKQERENVSCYKPRPLLRIDGDDFGVKIPAVMIAGKLADFILGEKYSLRDIQEKIDKNMNPHSFLLPGKTVTMDISFNREPVPAHNIAAKVEGSDPELKNEVVIVGAHYDHVGKDNCGRVHGGADDNASGTAVVMELARAFRDLEPKPKRTILFILFTAEERGLLGSRYYVKDPLFPLEKTLALINLDMVGRNDVNQVSVMGKYQYPGLFKIIEAVNKKSVNFELNLSVEEFVRNSDQFPFMRFNVPCLLFNSGTHDQLHTPEDTVDRIIVEKVEKAAHLVFLSLWEISNLPAGAVLKGKDSK
jgi:hypothetical protein